MNANRPSTPNSHETLKTVVRSLFVVTLGAAIFSAVSSLSGTSSFDVPAVASAKATTAATAPGSGMPAPSSTATEGNVVDMTYSRD